MLRHELPYSPDSSGLFARIAHLPWAVYLDSGKPGSQYGRYDIMAARPFVQITTNGDKTDIWKKGEKQESTDDPFALLNQQLAEYSGLEFELPFEGGAIGYWGYDLARRVERLPSQAEAVEDIPEMVIGFYDWAVVVDHRAHRCWLVSHLRDSATSEQWQDLCGLFEQPNSELDVVDDFRVTSDVISNMSGPVYEEAFNKIKRYIQEGDCYQVNLAQRFSARAEGDGWAAYKALRRISPAPFMAYMRLPGTEILSASPERFLQVSGRHVETRPIKGTRPRDIDPQQDFANAEDLQSSTKDRAENLMIVDLLRNDISKSCETGSVRADRMFALESFANVHHLVSTVTGRLAAGHTAVDLLRGCFPGGSITGAPKLRSMEIIEELEPNRRGLYCGAIGYIGFDGNMDTNIAIRTAIYSRQQIRFWAGGGIVADSEMQKEYRETWDKASSMLDLMREFRDQD